MAVHIDSSRRGRHRGATGHGGHTHRRGSDGIDDQHQPRQHAHRAKATWAGELA
jgi:hypothetical protein